MEVAVPTPTTVEQPDMECEGHRDDFNVESISNLNSQARKEGIMSEIIESSIPNISGTTLQPSSKSPIF